MKLILVCLIWVSRCCRDNNYVTASSAAATVTNTTNAVVFLGSWCHSVARQCNATHYSHLQQILKNSLNIYSMLCKSENLWILWNINEWIHKWIIEILMVNRCNVSNVLTLQKEKSTDPSEESVSPWINVEGLAHHHFIVNTIKMCSLCILLTGGPQPVIYLSFTVWYINRYSH